MEIQIVKMLPETFQLNTHSHHHYSIQFEYCKDVQTTAAHEYSLEKTQIVSNSDGGNGYSAERFQEAFSQSELPLLHQLDAYHIQQAVNRTFGYKKSKYKDMVR